MATYPFLGMFPLIPASIFSYDPSLFAVKNIAMIYIAMRELWNRLQYWRMKKRAGEVRGELIPTQAPEEEN